MEYMHELVRNIRMIEDYHYFTPENKDAPFIIDLCGISYCDGTYRIERKCSELFVFEYILEGTGIVISDAVTYKPSAGDVYILHKGSNHLYYSDGEHPWTKIWFNVYGPLVIKLLEAYSLEQTVLIKGCELYSLFERFNYTVTLNEPATVILSRCALILHEIVAGVAQRVHKGEQSSTLEVLALKRYLDQNIGKKVALEELARLVYRSESQTIRLFKRELHETPYAYLLRKKIEMAESLLKGTKIPIKEIAFDLGFSDQHYFSNLFKQRTGKSPIFYRNPAKK
jgi:AraC family transcriptional regulator of arabinose operon